MEFPLHEWGDAFTIAGWAHYLRAIAVRGVAAAIARLALVSSYVAMLAAEVAE
jgi:hypothetical protein